MLMHPIVLRYPADWIAADGSYTRAWQELGGLLRASMSEAWRSRFRGRLDAWLAAVSAEARLAAEQRSARRPPSFEVSMAVRTVAAGVLPAACWIEHAEGRELDGAVLADEGLARAERLASRIVVFQGDLAHVDEDARRARPNAVLSVAADDGVPLEVALDTVEELHDFDVGELASTCDRLVRRHGETARSWALGLTHLVAGHATALATARPRGEAAPVIVEAAPPLFPLRAAAA